MGPTPLANSLPDAGTDRSEPRYPLDLAFCSDCGLVQIIETVPPEVLFSDYVYFSSYSDTMVEHARRLVEKVIARRSLGGESLVLEIASNDGYLLQHYVRAGIPVLGVEAAANVAAVAVKERGIPTRVAFFGEKMGELLASETGGADVVHAHNVLAHVADLNGFVAGIRLVLKPYGVAIIEAPYVVDMVNRCEFDTIYHEHLCYFSLTALIGLFGRSGLRVVDVAEVPIHGGSLQLTVARQESPQKEMPSVGAMLDREREWGVGRLATYAAFAERTQELTRALVKLLRDLKAAGRSLAAYGAAAKGATLLNYAGIGPELLDFVADRSPHKQGKLVPGVHLPIRGPEALTAERPDYVLLLAWNFAEEILEQQAEYRAGGGHFIIPVPAPTVR